MKSYRQIRIEDYSYILPKEKIASYPLDERDKSKLLVYRDGRISDEQFSNIGQHIDKDNILIFNETKVIRSRLMFRKASGALIEIFCLEPHKPSDYEQALSSSGPVEWKCIVGNLKKWKEGSLELRLKLGNRNALVRALKVSREDKHLNIRFEWDNSSISFSEILEEQGHMPIPPYLERDDEELDNTRYQTVYSLNKGSVAAPTAGLHFTDRVLRDIKARGIVSDSVTLHVSAGTFLPVKSKTIEGHEMHREHFFVKRKTIEQLKSGDIIAVGTTSVRTIETLYHLGNRLLNNYLPQAEELSLDQWEAYEADTYHGRIEALDALIKHIDKHKSGLLSASTSIIIVPGYRFRIVKGLITNFHMPSSTLLLLLAALTGDEWKKVYKHALENNYRFLSYGDSSLIYPSQDSPGIYRP